MLAGKHLPGASETALNLVGDKKHTMFVANIRDDAEELGGRRHEAAFAENRLRNHRGNVFRSNHTLKGILKMTRAVDIAGWIFQGIRATIAVAIWNAIYVGWKWSKAGLVRMSFAGKCQGHQTAAVEGVFEGNDSRAASMGPGNFDSIFDGLGPGVQKNSFFAKVARRDAIHPLSQTNVFFVRRDLGTGVQKIFQLRFNRRKHCLVAVS